MNKLGPLQPEINPKIVSPDGPDWTILNRSDASEKVSFSGGSLVEAPEETQEKLNSLEEAPKNFAEQELGRIAGLVGRAPDDPEVIRLNLALRYRKFEQLKGLYESQKKQGILIQQGTMEDVATAKRELVEAMELTGPFRDIAEKEKKSNAKFEAKVEREKKDFSRSILTHKATGRDRGEDFFLKEQEILSRIESEKEEQTNSYAIQRANAADDILAKMPETIKKLESSEIFQTYELYKDKDPEPPIASRRAGTDGVYNEDHSVNFDLFERPAKKTDTKDNSNPDNPAKIKILDEKGRQTKEYLATEQGKKELEIEAAFDNIVESTDRLAVSGVISVESARKIQEFILDKASMEIDAVRSNLGNTTPNNGSSEVNMEEKKKQLVEMFRKKIEEEKRKQLTDALKKKLEEDERKQIEADEDEKRKQLEEEKTKLEEEEKTKLEEEEKEKLTIEQAHARILEIDKRMAEIEKRPLVAVNADFSRDKKNLAEALAERDLKIETEKANLIKRFWKGKLFKNYFENKYAREYLAGIRKIKTGDGEKNLSSVIRSESKEVIAKFVLGVTDGMDYIHKNSKNGEKLDPEDTEFGKQIRGAVAEFAQAELEDGKTLADLEQDFKKRMAEIMKNYGGNRRSRHNEINNYIEVATMARRRVEHGMSIGAVMGGFEAYHAEVRSESTNEVYLDSVDKLFKAVETGKIDPASTTTESSPAEPATNSTESSPVNSTPDSADTKPASPTTGESAPSSAEFDNEALSRAGDRLARAKINKQTRGIIGDEGLEFMITRGGYDDDRDATRFWTWWQGLSDDAKDAVKEYYTSGARETDEILTNRGGSLYFWLTSNRQI